jgi:protein transport protein SEC24
MDSDSTLGVALTFDASVPDNTNVVLQCAVLYTTAGGERRIRVHTLSLKATSDLRRCFAAPTSTRTSVCRCAPRAA